MDRAKRRMFGCGWVTNLSNGTGAIALPSAAARAALVRGGAVISTGFSVNATTGRAQVEIVSKVGTPA